MSIFNLADKNFEILQKCTYPGRGVIIGKTYKHEMVQVYWIMGRSSNSRNRIFVREENGFVKTKAFDEAKLEDPSLIIYYPVKYLDNHHIVTNGDQTDTIYKSLKEGKSFEAAINRRTFEPDPPNYTPRISGIVYPEKSSHKYTLSINKTINNDEDYSVRNFFNYTECISGCGHCITTYVDDGNPLPSFMGEPLIVPIFDRDKILDKYWKALNNDHLVSLLVKVINMDTGKVEIQIKNKLA